jgi:hypothetical protein
MTQSASHVSSGGVLDSYDFNRNYKYLKKLIEELKTENSVNFRKEIFGEEEPDRTMTKKQMKQLFKFLRKIESHYKECCNPPIPEDLEKGIRKREASSWLPWEQEAIEKVDVWRAALQERKLHAREMFNRALAEIRNGQMP